MFWEQVSKILCRGGPPTKIVNISHGPDVDSVELTLQLAELPDPAVAPPP